MKTAKAKVEEIFLDDSIGIQCPPDLIPAPGQYIHAYKDASNAPLPVSIYFNETTPNGFRSAPLQVDWRPSDTLTIRGPLGHGFRISNSAKKIALIAFENSISCLNGLIPIALKQNAEVVLLSDSQPNNLPEIIEVQPLNSMNDILAWADYVAIDIVRENLNQLKVMLQNPNQLLPKVEAQILIHSSMPCGGLAECGVCALSLNQEWKMICKEGPVFNLSDLKFF